MLRLFKTYILLFAATVSVYATPPPFAPNTAGETPTYSTTEPMLVYINSDINAAKSSKRERPYPCRAIYLTPWSAGNRKFLDETLDTLDDTPINALVVDVKVIPGIVAWSSENQLAKDCGAVENILGDLTEFADYIHSRGYYLIGRVAVFPDHRLATYANGRYALVDAVNGGIWISNGGWGWTGMFSPTVWEYHTALGKEIADAGFDEIQFDYIRFPTEDSSLNAALPYWRKGAKKEDAINGFCKYADEELEATGVKISADVFGFSALYEKRNPEGQDIDDMAKYLDVLYPMAYPSHYGWSFYWKLGKRRRPYAIVYKTVEVAKNRVKDTDCVIIPYIQGFKTAAVYYDTSYIVDQMLAAEDAGAAGWVVWNGLNQYHKTYEALKIYEEIRYNSPHQQRPVTSNLRMPILETESK